MISKQQNATAVQKHDKLRKFNLQSQETSWIPSQAGLMLVLLQNIATCGFMPSTGFQRASDPVQFFLNLKIVRLVTECFLRIGIKKSCLIQELLTSPNYQLEQKLIQRKLCWSDQVARLLAMTKTMEEEEASLSEHPETAIVLSFIPSHQNIIPSNHR